MKYLTLIILALVTTSTHADFWDNCTAYGGTIITANKYGSDQGGLCNDPSNPNLTNNCNGKRFCKSSNSMNWWSSFTWCEAIGGKLASFESLCPGHQTNPTGTCANLKGISSGWNASSTGWNTGNAFYVKLPDGTVDPSAYYGASRGRTNKVAALCEE